MEKWRDRLQYVALAFIALLIILATGLLVVSLWGLWGALMRERSESPERTRQAHGLDLQHASIERCRKTGGFAVMGFGAVVCVEPGSVKWSEEIPW